MSNSINPYDPPSDPDATIAADETQSLAKFKTARRWGLVAIIALTVNIALAAAGLVFDGRLFAAYTGFAVADYMDGEWVGVQLDRVKFTFNLITCCRWLTAAAVITWMYQCHRNLTVLGHAELDSKPIWVVLCWFIPLMNFFCPYQVMQEIWRRSDPFAIHTEPDSGTPLVTTWWLTWLAAIALVAWGNHLDHYRDTEWDMIWLSGTDVLHFSATIVAALLLISIIVKLNRRQVERFVALAAQNREAST